MKIHLNKLSTFLSNIEKYSSAYNTRLYHGTSFDNLNNILKTGFIQPNISNGDALRRKTIFLTPDLELATRYAIGYRTSLIDYFEIGFSNPIKRIPIVLDVIISKNTRIKKLKPDPLDRPYEDSDFLVDNITETAEKILKDIESWFKQNISLEFSQFIVDRLRYYHLSELENPDLFSIQSFDGLDIFKAIKLSFEDIIKTNQKHFEYIYLNRREYLKKIYSFLTSTTYNYLFINQNGILKLDSEIYENFEQLHYDKPISAGAIKGFYIPQKYTSFNENKNTLKTKLLPGEKTDLVAKLKKLFASAAYIVQQALSKDLQADSKLELYILDSELFIFAEKALGLEIVSEIKKALEEKDYQTLLELLHNAESECYEIESEPYAQTKSADWVYIPIQIYKSNPSIIYTLES